MKYHHYKGKSVTVLDKRLIDRKVKKGDLIHWSQGILAKTTDDFMPGDLAIFYTENYQDVWARPQRIFEDTVNGQPRFTPALQT